MNSGLATNPTARLAANSGQVLLSAPEAILKGALESELEVAIIAGARRGGLGDVLDLGSSAATANLLRQHAIRLVPAPDAGRAVTLAGHAARSDRASIALVPNDQLDQTIGAISVVMAEPLNRGGALCLLLEDQPRQAPSSCPRQIAARLGLPSLEPANLEQLRTGVESALRLSRAGRCPIGLIVHSSILRSIDTLTARPNRVLGSVDAVLARRKRPRGPRWAETGGWLRMARRLELNRFRAMPSPGERVTVGFVTVGPADASLLHISYALGLHGRVPVLQLGLVHPVDESAVRRLLERSEHVIVLEPRPGSIEPEVLAVAEGMRREGEHSPQVALVWGRRLPPPAASSGALLESASKYEMTSEHDLHPSILVRKIAHLLHAIRPTIQVTSQLMPEGSSREISVPQRESRVGMLAALTVVRRIVTDVDQWLRERAPLEERGVAPTALAIDGTEAAGVWGRIVQVETWEHRRFQEDGLSALVQAAREDRPWIMLICENASEEIRDLERLARGAVPAERAERVTLQVGNLADRTALRDLIREAAMADRLTVIIIRDGPPPKYDVAAIEQSLAEIDRLGFEPRQRLVRSTEEVCAMHPRESDATEIDRLDHDRSPIKTEITADRISPELGRILVRVRPLLEEVEVIRTKPPLRSWQVEGLARPPTPQPIHASQPQWRAHIAGFRGDSPGLAALTLCEAGRLMGYHVRGVCDPLPIGPGRRAWAQVLFTRPRGNEPAVPLSASIPYGEADLLIGLDRDETLRAIGPDPSLRVAFAERTHMVANLGRFGTETNDMTASPHEVVESLGSRSHREPRLLEDFAAACRTWFHTDRVADMALVGAAFQMGLIPVSPEAIEAAASAVEARGFGRARETFEFGRRLAADARLFARPKDDPRQEGERTARRMVLSLRGGLGGRKRARGLQRLLHESLLVMPGLAETEAGRAVRDDFIVASHRCLIWGGLEYARQYAELITSLYRVDRGETGRGLTRNAVLPLAEAMLIRDPIYIASMASSTEQSRHMRRRLNVKAARGDRIERRYLTRLEVIGFNRRLRAEVRTSDWPARATAMTRRLTPLRWRGTKRERELREYLIDLIQRAAQGASEDYERWAEAMRRLHAQASENRLRGMALAEVRMLVES